MQKRRHHELASQCDIILSVKANTASRGILEPFLLEVRQVAKGLDYRAFNFSSRSSRCYLAIQYHAMEPIYSHQTNAYAIADQH